MNSKYRIGNIVYQSFIDGDEIKFYKMKVLGIYYTDNYEYIYKCDEYEDNTKSFYKEEELLTFEQVKEQLEEWR